MSTTIVGTKTTIATVGDGGNTSVTRTTGTDTVAVTIGTNRIKFERCARVSRRRGCVAERTCWGFRVNLKWYERSLSAAASAPQSLAGPQPTCAHWAGSSAST
jgi:hypothetical protein